MNPISTFETNRKLVHTHIWCGILLIAISVPVTLLVGLGVPLGLGIVMVSIGFWHRQHKPVRMYRDHMELKFGLATSLHLVKYRDLVRLEGRSGKTPNLFVNEQGNEKKIKLSLTVLNADDRLRLVRWLERTIRDYARLRQPT